MKEMQPQYVATFSEKPAVLEGHPFIVEAGVSLGGAEVSGWFYPSIQRAPSIDEGLCSLCSEAS